MYKVQYLGWAIHHHNTIKIKCNGKVPCIHVGSLYLNPLIFQIKPKSL